MYTSLGRCITSVVITFHFSSKVCELRSMKKQVKSPINQLFVIDQQESQRMGHFENNQIIPNLLNNKSDLVPVNEKRMRMNKKKNEQEMHLLNLRIRLQNATLQKIEQQKKTLQAYQRVLLARSKCEEQRKRRIQIDLQMVRDYGVQAYKLMKTQGQSQQLNEERSLNTLEPPSKRYFSQDDWMKLYLQLLAFGNAVDHLTFSEINSLWLYHESPYGKKDFYLINIRGIPSTQWWWSPKTSWEIRRQKRRNPRQSRRREREQEDQTRDMSEDENQ